MHSPALYPESPTAMDQDDVVYPCKGCGEILEEGKAFELAGNRWHIDCFRCNTCHTLLDSDANLLLLGDGSLICNNCTYSCSACNNKIEDLAILTGDQAFCASCFCCRNCKNKIENLRYARTSQGIFCMDCHESLMNKRRKNRIKQKQKATNSLNKSLPELPPQSTFSSDGIETPPSELEVKQDTPNNRSPHIAAAPPVKSEPSKSLNRDLSSSVDEAKDNLTLPASTYQASQSPTMMNSGLTAMYDVANDNDGLFVPLVLDPNPAIGSSPLTNGREYSEAVQPPTAKGHDSRQSRDQYNRPPAPSRPSREFLHDGRQDTSRSSSTERKSTSPHIAHQAPERSRQSSEQTGRQSNDHIADAMRRRGQNMPTSPRPSMSSGLGAGGAGHSSPSDFKLQDAPKPKKTNSRRSSKDKRSPSIESPMEMSYSSMTPNIDLPRAASPTQMESSNHYTSQDAIHERSPAMPQGRSSQHKERGQAVERPKRGDSLAAVGYPRKEVGSGPTPASNGAPNGEPGHDRKGSSASVRQQYEMNGSRAISKPMESPSNSKSLYDSATLPASSTRQSALSAASDPFTAPRHAPAPPINHRANDSNSTVHTDAANSSSPATNSRYNYGDDESEGKDGHDGVLRKMSNAMKGHGRSFSDRGLRSPGSQKNWTKSPLNGSVDLGSHLGSPLSSTSPETREESIVLKSQLRRAQLRITELEAHNHNLEIIVNGSADINRVDTELKEKRSTMAVLDTQREIVVRELEIMTEHLKQAKESNRPMDLATFKSEVMQDFAMSLKKLKLSLTSEIEELMQRRNEITKEISDLIQMKDKGFQEFEALSNRNTQLREHNNELTQSIQSTMKANKEPNGLGLYLGGNNNGKERPDTSNNDLRNMMLESSTTMVQPDADQEGAAVITTPHVVKIKQTKPNMLRKGGIGKTLRGIKGAFVPERSERTPAFPPEGVPYNLLQDAGPGAPPLRSATDGGRNKFGGFFGSERNGAKHLKSLQNTSNPSLSEPVAASQLFGSELSSRCEFERREIPCIVSRCVEEVELRGMDVEGVYRKSGGSGQVNTVKAGFEKSDEYDISDPDLEIHAVTSTLKQYFRRLPVPLITFEVYDHLLEAARHEDRERRPSLMRDAVNTLPKAHRDCLEFLIFHLARVTLHEKDNLMTPLNLAVVFAPTIMRPATIEREMTDMQIQRQTVQCLLEHYKAVFDAAA